ncbi:MAG: hypothetical protein M0T74_10955 [Desulfitobacterium hafniense]|nr:hypothetical protein [Desulfitobacterium hafniense]
MKDKNNSKSQSIANKWNARANLNLSSDVVRNDKGQREHDASSKVRPKTGTIEGVNDYSAE